MIKDKAKNTVGRPRLGKEAKKVYSVRLEPETHAKILEKFGTLTKALEASLEEKNNE